MRPRQLSTFMTSTLWTEASELSTSTLDCYSHAHYPNGAGDLMNSLEPRLS